MYRVGGEMIHSRTANPNNKHFGRRSGGIDLSQAEKIWVLGKYKYLYPLNKEIRKQIEPLAKPYPKKKCDVGVKRSTASFQDVGGGAIPTTSLHLERQYAY